MLSWLGTFRRNRRTPSRSDTTSSLRRRRTILGVEQLEVRAVPATFTVKNLNNMGNDSLRWGIEQANQSADSFSTIDFDEGLTGTISLTAVLPSLQKDIEIRGLGAITVERDTAAGAFRIFNVSAGRTCQISHLKIANGDAGIGHGGGVRNDGTLYLISVVMENNRATQGGAIYNNGTLEVAFSTLNYNVATAFGGGIFNRTGKTATVSNGTRLFGNQAALGGGILNDTTASLTITGNSEIDGNFATSAGGGINNAGSLSMDGGVLTNNDAGEKGGGLWNGAGSANLTGVDIEYNGSQKGGGVYINGGAVTLNNCILRNNLATVLGAGIAFNPASPPTIIGGTITDPVEAD